MRDLQRQLERQPERQHKRDVIGDRDRPAVPEFYMPAMWPVELQQLLTDWFVAWRKRRLYRCLLRLNDQQLDRRDLSRSQLLERERRPLRQIVAEQRCRRGCQDANS